MLCPQAEVAISARATVAMWGRLLTCGRLLIGLRECGYIGRPVNNLPHMLTIMLSLIMFFIFEVYVAFVFVDLRVGIAMPIERHANPPRTREHLGIFDRGLVLN